VCVCVGEWVLLLLLLLMYDDDDDVVVVVVVCLFVIILLFVCEQLHHVLLSYLNTFVFVIFTMALKQQNNKH
jgi:hypothetical protein